MFKEILQKTLFIHILLGSFAFASDGNWYLSYDATYMDKGSEKVYNILPAGELIGNGQLYHTLKFGVESLNPKDNHDARAFLAFYTNKDRNNELGFGIGGEMLIKSFDSMPNLSYIIGADCLVGWQNVKNKEVVLSKMVTTSSHLQGVTLSRKSSYIANYTDNTLLFSIGLSLGMNYIITKNVSVNLAYIGRWNQTQVKWKYQEASFFGGESSANVQTWNNGLRAGIGIKF